MDVIARLIILSVWLVACVGGWAAPAAEFDFAQLESVARAELKRSDVPGCAVEVVLGERTIFARGFGVANVDTGEAVTAEMLFRLGSTTKMFTAATLVSLAEEGKVRFDAPIGDYIPGLNPKLARLTLHQLMTHTAGLADETKMEGPHDESALSEVWRNRGDDLCFTEPGKIWSYSNPGYWLVGLVAEKVFKEHYADAVRDQILAPLGLKRATFRPMEAMTWPTAIGHGPEGQGKPTVIRPLADNAAGWPAGQLFISANEYARFCIAFMNGGKIGGKQALSSFVIEKLSAPYVSVPGGSRHYGYGLSIEDEDGLRWVAHGGSRTGYGSVMRMCPEKKFAVIVLCNKTGASLPRVAQKASEIVLGITGPKREPRNKPVEVAQSELERYAGTYSNGKTTIRLFIRDGKLMAPAGGKLEGLGENRFVRTGGLVGPDTEMTFVPGDDGKMEYLCRGGRALKRVR